MLTLSDSLLRFPGFADVVTFSKPLKWLDLSEQNKDLSRRDLTDSHVFSKYVFEEMLEDNTYIGIGGYAEDRVIYKRRRHFAEDQSNPRSIHLGTDIWTSAGEPVYAPLNARVHSFAFNDHFGDYGPTIILTHDLDNHRFYTLYGHLSKDSLEGLFVGKTFRAEEKIGSIGNYPENGDWPPHLHFQIISDMGDRTGDFPGVCSVADRAYYLSICINPDLILRLGENNR